MSKLGPIAVSQQRCFVPSISLQQCATTATKVQSRRSSSHSKENSNISSWLQNKIPYELFTSSQTPTENPPTYVVKDVNDEVIQVKFYEPELVNFVSTVSKVAT